jgi:hypothetical protein
MGHEFCLVCMPSSRRAHVDAFSCLNFVFVIGISKRAMPNCGFLWWTRQQHNPDLVAEVYSE